MVYYKIDCYYFSIASNSDISFSQTPEFLLSTSEMNCDKLYNENSQFDIIENKNDKDLIYVKFVYEITKEIMDRGYYKDRDIEMVFEKHVKKNVDTLKKVIVYMLIICK